MDGEFDVLGFPEWKYVFGIQTHGTGAQKRYCTSILREQDLSTHSLLGKEPGKIYEAAQGQSSRAPGTVCLGASSPGIQQAELCVHDGGAEEAEKAKSFCEGCERSRDLTLWLKIVVIKEVDKSCPLVGWLIPQWSQYRRCREVAVWILTAWKCSGGRAVSFL